MLGVLWTIMCISCKNVDKPAKQAKIVTEGLQGKVFLSSPGDLVTIALSWFVSEKGGQG